MIIDSHTHLTDKRYELDAQKIIEELPQNGIEKIISVGYDFNSSVEGFKLAKENEPVFAAVGIHPHDSKDAKQSDYDEFVKLTKDLKVVAIGEIGLDYYYDLSPREIQKKVFLEQLELAHSTHMPVIIHLRDAYEDMRKLLFENSKFLQQGFVLHCYSGSLDMAKIFSKLDNAYFSFGGSLTFKNARQNAEVVSYLPLEKILVETDCPYLTPMPFRGQRNEPKYINFVIDKMSEILSVSRETVVNATNMNTKTLFPRLN